MKLPWTCDVCSTESDSLRIPEQWFSVRQSVADGASTTLRPVMLVCSFQCLSGAVAERERELREAAA